MQGQLNFSDPFTASELARGGMNLALANANMKTQGWADKAAALLDEFLLVCTTTFLAEDFRAFAQLRGLEEPPSRRAFGGVISHAAHEKKIVWVGYGRTTNPRAHGTPASRWMKA